MCVRHLWYPAGPKEVRAPLSPPPRSLFSDKQQLSGRGQKCTITARRSAVTESTACRSALARGPGTGTVSTTPQARHTSALPPWTGPLALHTVSGSWRLWVLEKQ